MSILVNKNSRIITQGMTGKTGQFHTRLCRDYGFGKECFVGGVNPKKAGQVWEGLPIFGSVKEAKEKTGANVSVIYVPPAGAAAAIQEASDAGIDLIVCITEGIPVMDMVKVRDHMKKTGSKSLLLGPNCPGLISPEKSLAGILPGNVFKKGNVGVISRSGTLTYEIVYHLTANGMGQSTAIGMGGDPVVGLYFRELLEMFQNDKDTESIVMIGEIGGNAEELAAEYIKKHVTKPVVAFIAGQSAPPGKQMGHAGAIISGNSGSAEEKIAALTAAGIQVANEPAEVPILLKASLPNK